MDDIQLMTRTMAKGQLSVVRRIADGFQPVQRFASVIGVNLDASILVRTHGLVSVPALAALEWVHCNAPQKLDR